MRLGIITISIIAIAFGTACGFNPVASHNPVESSELDLEKMSDDPLQEDLFEAISNGSCSRIQELILNGADPNAITSAGASPLIWAMGHDALESFDCLLRFGADPNRIVPGTLVGKRGNQSMMHVAARHESSAWLKAALEHGGNPNLVASTALTTPIYGTIMGEDRPENLLVLAEAGANLDHRDLSRTTPMLMALQANNYFLALTLLRLGADPNIADRTGGTVCDYLGDYPAAPFPTDRDEEAYPKLIAVLEEKGCEIPQK